MKTLKVKFIDEVQGRRNFLKPLLESMYKVEWVDHERPDVVFFGDGKAKEHLTYDCLRIYVPIENNLPNWGQCDYALSYLDLPSRRNLRLPYYALDSVAEELQKKNDDIEAILKKKTKFCAFVQSNGNPIRTKRRISFFHKLSKYKKVDSGGAFLNNLGYQVGANKEAFYESYKFVITFENHAWDGYTSEKIVNAMTSRCIPIYWGSPKIETEFNPDSFIHLRRFKSEDAAVEFIKKIDQDDDLYKTYLKAPYFHNDEPNKFFDQSRVEAFLRKAIESPPFKRNPFYFKHILFDKKKKILPYFDYLKYSLGCI